MDEDVKKILAYAAMAPSGDNSQPWRLKVDKETVYLFNIPDRDNPYLNYNQSGSYVAHGGFIENISIAAPHFGYEASIKLFPDSTNENLVASIFLKKNPSVIKDNLFELIPKRSTNRKPYKEKPLTTEQRDYLETPEEGMGRVIFVEDKNKKETAARAGSAAEIVILENKKLHSYLFGDVVWSAKEEQEKRTGLYIDTMEFNPVQKFLFKRARKWSFMKFAIAIKFPHFIAKEDAKLYATGAAMGMIVIENNAKENWINAGRLMQRVWLKTAELGLSLQPITATLFFGQRIVASDVGDLLDSHRDLLSRAYNDIRAVFQVTDAIPAMMFRVGFADPPSARCSRINLQEKLIS